MPHLSESRIERRTRRRAESVKRLCALCVSAVDFPYASRITNCSHADPLGLNRRKDEDYESGDHPFRR